MGGNSYSKCNHLKLREKTFYSTTSEAKTYDRRTRFGAGCMKTNHEACVVQVRTSRCAFAMSTRRFMPGRLE